MSTQYISTNGMIWGEISSAGVMRSYGHDAIGSVTETFVSGAIENSYRYKPYGATLAKTGAAADPNFLWDGSHGYRATTLPNATHYIRRRHYSDAVCRWTSADPLWPGQRAFAYAAVNPASYVDPSGQIYATTISGPMALSTCGAACVGANWKTDAGEANGFLVQHITNTRQATTCPGSKLTIPNPCPEYWEVWGIEGNNFYDLYSDYSINTSLANEDDTWKLPDAGGCSKDNFTMVGVAKFVPSGKLPTGFARGAGGTCAGTLLATSTPPNGWTDTGGYTRTFKTNWSCCCLFSPDILCYGPYQATQFTYSGKAAKGMQSCAQS